MLIEKWITVIVIGVALFLTGFAKGCAYAQQDYKEAETKFIERVKVIKEIERIEVPKFIQTVTSIHTESERLIEAAKNEAPNPSMCDLSPGRVRRISEAATRISE